MTNPFKVASNSPNKREIDPRLATSVVLVTAGVHAKMSNNSNFKQEVVFSVARFQMLDWGDTCKTDAKTNEICLTTHDRLFAVYHTCEGKIYIIADAAMENKPYEHITVLFPSEY